MWTQLSKKGPCYDCKEHGVDIHCHSTCEKYIDWEAMRKAEREYIYRGKQKNEIIDSFKKSVVYKAKKRSGKIK